ncbi:MAG TPA: hypothetical protein VGM16_12270 [Gammaproteobacteria bacterium]|jgi:hypothetical protein
MNKLCSVIAFLSVLMTCGGCDWSDPHFLGRYQLDGTDGHHYVVDIRHNEIVVEQQVVDLETSSHYLLVLRELAQSYLCGPHDEQGIYTEYSGQLEYWAIDADSGVIQGPLDVNGYESFLKSHGLPDVELAQTSEFVPYNASPRIPTGLRKSCEPI